MILALTHLTVYVVIAIINADLGSAVVGTRHLFGALGALIASLLEAS